MAYNENLELDSDFTREQYAGGAGQSAPPQAPTVTTTFGNALFTAADAAAARTVLGLGSIAAQAASNVTITGGTINGTSVGATTASTVRGTTVNATTEFQQNGTKVVGAQGAAVADAAGGATVDAEARAAINALLARLRSHGLIAT